MSGSVRRAESSPPMRCSSALEKRACKVRWQIGWIATFSRPPRLSGTAGQYIRLPAKISNVSDKPAKDIVAYVTLVEMTKGQKAPVDLEDWSAHRAVTIGSLASGQSRDVSWRLRLIKGGDYVIYANAIVNGSSRAAVGKEVHLTVTAHKNLNPGGVLPVALGVPVLAGAALFAPVFIRRRKLTT